MKKHILKTITLLAIWAITYALTYFVSTMSGRNEVSDWAFYCTVGFTVTFGPQIYAYITKKFNAGS